MMPITNLTAKAISYNDVELDWDPDIQADYYIILQDGIDTELVSKTNQIVIHNLTPNQSYTFSVEAHYPPTTGVASTITISTSKFPLVHIFAPNNPIELVTLINTRLGSMDYVSNFRVQNLTIYPKLNKVLSGFSFASVKSAIISAKANGIGYIDYDNEPNNGNESTPQVEMVEPAKSTDTAGAWVLAAGLKFAIEPSHNTLMLEYQNLSVFQLSFVLIQTQHFADSPTISAKFIADVKAISNFIKSKRPKCQIFIQVNLGFDTTPNKQKTLDFINVNMPYIDGVSFVLPTAADLAPMLTAIGR